MFSRNSLILVFSNAKNTRNADKEADPKQYYIQNYREQTARSAVCPLSDHVTFPFSHKHLSARKDGGHRE